MVAVSPPDAPARAGTMKAVVQRGYGLTDVLHVEEVEKPVVGDDDVLVRVRASSVDPADSYQIKGLPLLMRVVLRDVRPAAQFPGADVAGEVEAVGKNVTEFRPGDAVFGAAKRAYAEYVTVGRKNLLVAKPANITFEQAGAIGIAGTTALQGLRDKGRIQPGQHVLIDGASGGVGTFAVQIAKAFGAHVTAVCSGRNADMVRSLGADEVIDRTREDPTRRGTRYDLILDVAGSRSLRQLRRMRTPEGMLVIVGAPKTGWVRLFARVVTALVWSRFSDRMMMFIARLKKEDFVTLKELIEAGKLRPVVDRTYPLSDIAEAVRYQAGWHARAKVVITM